MIEKITEQEIKQNKLRWELIDLGLIWNTKCSSNVNHLSGTWDHWEKIPIGSEIWIRNRDEKVVKTGNITYKIVGEINEENHTAHLLSVGNNYVNFTIGPEDYEKAIEWFK